MNWTNYRRLREFLESLPDEQFDYAYYGQGNGPCGCVAHHAVRIFQTGETGIFVIEAVLAVTQYEAIYLFGASGCREIEPGARSCCYPTTDVKGRRGRLEALRRLAVVAARYGGEPASTPEPKLFVADDAAFLASVRALIGQPLVEAE